MYGLKQSGRLWNRNVIAFYKKLGFRPLNVDLSILMLQNANEITIVSDNFLLALSTLLSLNSLKKNLAKEYDMKDLRKVKTIIG